MNREDLLPEGTYEAVAVDRPDEQGVCAYARITETKGGDPQATAFFQILNLPEGISMKYPPRWDGSFKSTQVGKENNKKTLAKITAESLRAMGWKSNAIIDIETEDLDQIVSITIEHSEWEGKWYAKVGWVNEAGGGAVKINVMDDAAKRKFSAMMMAHVSKLPPVAGKRYVANGASNGANGAQGASTGSQPPPQEEPPPPEHDDIPF